MGRGPSIQELAEQEQAFREYLDQIRGDIEKDKADDTIALDKIITTFYSDGGWAYSPLMQSDLLEVQQISTWSLANVVKIMTGVRDAIFGSSAPPPGVEIEKPSGTSNAIDKMQDLNLLALNRAFSAVQSILETFAVESSYRGKAITKVEVVAPGLTLFLSIRSDVWKNQGFFNSDSIGQYLFIMRSYFSVEQAGDIALYNTVLAYTELANAFDARVVEIAQRIGDISTPFSALMELAEEMGFYSEQLALIHAKIDELRQEKVARLLASSKKAIATRVAKLAA